MKTAMFCNFTSEEFVGWWDGKSKKFAPGQQVYMPDYLAQHFAKHLTNRELLRSTPDGTLIHKDGDKMTSPKFPEQVPMFMDLFNKAYIPEETETELGTEKDDIDALIGSANKNRAAEKDAKKDIAQDPTQPQVILPPEGDEDDEDSFEGKPQEINKNHHGRN